MGGIPTPEAARAIAGAKWRWSDLPREPEMERIAEPVGWQAIETAPRDGLSVLLYEGFEPAVQSGYWRADDGEWARGSGTSPFWRVPTHWMPLPEPPR
jgi:hypothetical protein